MPATFQIPLVTPVDDDLITADLWNNEFDNLYDNFTPAGVDDYSATTPEMQTTVDPYPGAVVSRPTSLQGEIERIRYMIAQITGKTYWYQDPDAVLSPSFPSGTKLVFFQSAVPTGWTLDATHNGKALRVVSSTGGGSGGSADPATTITLAHTHTVSSHTHDMANHTHTGPSHTHTVPRSGWGTAVATDGNLVTVSSGTSKASADNTTGSSGTGATSTPSTNTTGAASPSTDSQLSNVSLAYIDVIVGTKD